MIFSELKCQAYLKKDLKLHESFNTLSKFINFAICQDNNRINWHNSQGFKNYCFSGFYPTEKEKIYKKGTIYEFSVRSLDKKFLETLQSHLRENINNPTIQVVDSQFKKVEQKFITELYSITPVVISTAKDEKNRPIYWTQERDGDILKLQRQLHENLLHKYKNFYNEDLQTDLNFIQLIELKNRVPQNIVMSKNGKKVTLFGNKFKIVPNEDETSQKLAFIALATGLGEKASFGGGFVLNKGMR